jgi:hypothetical protein
MTGLPQRAASLSANSLAATSGELPDGKGTMMRTTRCGHVSARDDDAEVETAIAAIRLAFANVFQVRMVSSESRLT